LAERFKLFRRERRNTREKAFGLVTATPALMEMLTLFDGTSASYGTVYRKLQPVRTVIDFLADAVSDTPIKVYRRESNGRPEVRDHGLAELLRQPNPFITSRRLIWRTVADLGIYGNAYWQKTEQRGRRLLVPIPPFRVTPRGGDLLSADAYDVIYPGRAPTRLSADEVVHFRLYDPEDPRIGSSKLEALRGILNEEVEASKSRRGYWRNAARNEGVLKHPDQLSDEALDRLRTQFENEYSGSLNTGKPLILEEGMEWQALSFSPKDSEFLQGRLFVLEATARVFNVPLALLSLTESATYASQREFHKQLYMDTLPPWYELIQSEIELQVLPWFADTSEIYVEFLADSKLRGDFIDRAEVLTKAIGRPWMTVKEGRNVENFENRGVPEDEELAVPVGPNLALEGMAEQTQQQPALAAVSELPAARAASTLVAFFDRQERSVLSDLGRGKRFNRKRWDRELAEVIGNRTLAEKVNMQTELELAEASDPHEVFERAKTLRAPLIAYDLNVA